MASTQVKLRFGISERDNKSLISFVSRHPRTDIIRCVRESDHYKKSIVVLSGEVKDKIIKGAQYLCDIKEMRNGARGYVATSATPVVHEVKMEVIHVRKALYQIKLSWGFKNKALFDPFDGKANVMRDPLVFAEYLSARVDIKDKDLVIDRFFGEAAKLKKAMKADGVDIRKLV